MFNVYIDRIPITYKSFTFSGGEVQVKIGSFPLYHKEDTVTIHAHINNSNDVMELLMITDALRRFEIGLKIKLKIPYLPYARQDRVCAKGEALSLKVFCDLINAQNYSEVEVWDVHSDVSLALLNNVANIHQYSLLYFVPKKNVVLVSPDAGAVKKTSEASKAYGLPMVTASKIRDVNTGEITGTEVHSGHIGDKDFLIVDDICDGGKTFVELAKVLRPLTNGNVLLYVTHGIFSKGLQVFDGLIDHIYCANRFPSPLPSSPNLTVINTKVYQ